MKRILREALSCVCKRWRKKLRDQREKNLRRFQPLTPLYADPVASPDMTWGVLVRLQDVPQWRQLAQTAELPRGAAGQVLDQAANGQHDARRAEEGEFWIDELYPSQKGDLGRITIRWIDIKVFYDLRFDYVLWSEDTALDPPPPPPSPLSACRCSSAGIRGWRWCRNASWTSTASWPGRDTLTRTAASSLTTASSSSLRTEAHRWRGEPCPWGEAQLTPSPALPFAFLCRQFWQKYIILGKSVPLNTQHSYFPNHIYVLKNQLTQFEPLLTH